MFARQERGVPSVEGEADAVALAEALEDSIPTLRRGIVESPSDDPADRFHPVPGAPGQQRVQPEVVLRGDEAADQRADQQQVGQQAGGDFGGKRDAQGAGRGHA